MRLHPSRVLVGLALLLSLAANVFLLLERQPNHGEESLRHDEPERVQGCEQELSVARECQQEVARMRTELAEARNSNAGAVSVAWS